MKIWNLSAQQSPGSRQSPGPVNPLARNGPELAP